MSDSIALSNAGFIDRSRFRTHFDGQEDTASAEAANDINRPIQIKERRVQPKRPVNRSLARLAVVGALPANTFALTSSQTPIKKRNKLQLAVTVLCLLLVCLGGYLSFVAWQNNKAVHTQAVKLTNEANKTSTTSGSTSASQALSTIKPTPKTVAAYAVAPNYPKILKIPSIGVDSIVGQTGILSNGALGTPSNVYYTDWYTGSAEPGQPGATLIDGHVSSWTAHGVFYNLHLLKPGDSIQIIKGDNSVVNYQVVKTQTYSSNNVDMQAAITPIDSSTSGLNLITCTGDVIKGTSQFNERVIVFASEVN